MKPFLFSARVSAFVFLAAGFATSHAAASHPDILRNYRFIPSHSTLRVTGGFAGIEEMFRARGTFGLVTGFEEGVTCAAIGCPPPPHFPFAEFVDVDASLVSIRTPTNVWDLDNTLNLSGLDGTFHPAAPNRLFFRGEEGQGWPFKLTAVRHGRLLHMFGENDEGCCDFFHYRFSALAYLTPHADPNLDGSVDSADYVLMRKLLGQSIASAGSGADASGDYDLWSATYGDNFDFSQFAFPEDGAGTVPEPTTLVMLLFAAVPLPIIMTRRSARRASV